MIVVWTTNAKRELRSVYAAISQTSIRYADSLIDRITQKTSDLARFPLIGPEVPEYEDASLREVFEHPYRIIYRIKPDRIEVLSMVHSARQLPSDPPRGR